jgi:hypothetical protein
MNGRTPEDAYAYIRDCDQAKTDLYRVSTGVESAMSNLKATIDRDRLVGADHLYVRLVEVKHHLEQARRKLDDAAASMSRIEERDDDAR